MKRLCSLVLSASLAFSGCGGFLRAIDAAHNGAFDSCYDAKYDDDLRCVNETDGILNQLEESTYQVYNEGLYVHVEDGNADVITKLTTGTGVLFKGGYLLTARHVIENAKEEINYSHLGNINSVDVKISESSYLMKDDHPYFLKPIIVGRENKLDYAWLKVKGDLNGLSTCPIKFGDTSKLENRDVTYLLGNVKNLGIRFSEGIVSRKKPSEFEIERTGDNFIIVTNDMHSGDSGGIVVAVNDGNFEIIGINRQIMERFRIHYIGDINKIVDNSLDILSKMKPSDTKSELLNLILGLKTN